MEKEKNEKAGTEFFKNFEPNVIAAFAYLFPFITGVVFFILEKKNKFIRFHAAQAVLFWLAAVGAGTIAQTMQVMYIGFLLFPVVRMLTTIFWLILIWKAYSNEEYEIPYIGKYAKNFVNK